ncbi:MAG: metalloregulator ArsR/SmtB family transcription factor [Sedimentisphaerales bacterium]|jgi:ArsR family transcriptional regulator|nr:metalloregulator ArsR/SmtB family transcription factor [Sedimentisphaerales bacterium]NLT75697.1 winged helix-turn-helix transcriptional regulator [Planctomycetota bacterium]
MDKKLASHAAEVLKALAHPIRLQVVEALEGGERSVGEIAEAVGEKQAITSQQLNIMKDKGILKSRREGARVFYWIENENAIRVLGCVHNHCRKKGKGRR